MGKHGDSALLVQAVDARVIQRPALAIRLRNIRRARVRKEEILVICFVQAADEIGGASSEPQTSVAVRQLGLWRALGAGQGHIRRAGGHNGCCTSDLYAQ